MEKATIDSAAMGRLTKALVFICGADHPIKAALRAAAESGSERDIKNARALFLKIEAGRPPGRADYARRLISLRKRARTIAFSAWYHSSRILQKRRIRMIPPVLASFPQPPFSAS